MSSEIKDIRSSLFALADAGYRAFNVKLIPTVPPETVIGVRTPDLRALARQLQGTPQARDFLGDLPHQYYEENNLHAFLLEGIRDFDQCVEQINRFLPYVNNWATCDQLLPKALARNPQALLLEVKRWLESGELYTRRFAIGMLMRHFLDQNFREEYLYLVASQHSEEYYLRMMVAWYFATALAKQYAAAIKVIEERILEPWTHNRAIQKALESSRISQEKKAYLKNLKIPLRKQS